MTDDSQYYSASEVRELDRLAIEEHHIHGFVLMQRAGAAAFNALQRQWPDADHLVIVCGTGNNGGDGLVIAGLAMEAGLAPEVFVIGNSAAIKGDALLALEYARNMNAPIHFLAVLPPLDAYPASTVIVDALHGTGLSGEVRGASRQAIDAINASGLPVMAIDMPSGLCSDTGAVLGACVKADLTMTFIGRKKGMLAGAGPAMCGKVVFDDLGVPPMIYRKLMPLSQA